jgi:SAM-dependent methyltransferase
MASLTWTKEQAQTYDAMIAGRFALEVLDPTVDLLLELSGGGVTLEFAIGTGRVALPLAERGVSVSGIELSPHMVDQLNEKPGSEKLQVVIGDMTTTRMPGSFKLVYLIFNTLMNVTTQDEQVAVFENAAMHLQAGGKFVIEMMVPQLHRVPIGEKTRVFASTDRYLGFETFDDAVGQISTSHHWMDIDGQLVRDSSPFRYVWPSELVLMGRLAGFRVADRWGGWEREPFTEDSTNQVVVFEKI